MPGRTWRSQKSMRSHEGQERKVVPSRNARRPHPEVPQSKSSTWRSFAPRSAEDEERKVVPSAGRNLQVLYGQWQLCGSSEDIKDARWALSSTFMALSLGLQFFRHVVTFFDKKLVHALCRRQEEDARSALSSNNSSIYGTGGGGQQECIANGKRHFLIDISTYCTKI